MNEITFRVHRLNTNFTLEVCTITGDEVLKWDNNVYYMVSNFALSAAESYHCAEDGGTTTKFEGVVKTTTLMEIITTDLEESWEEL